MNSNVDQSEQMRDVALRHMPSALELSHKFKINNRLRELGAVSYDMALPENSVLPLVIEPDEAINGIVYGRYKQDFVERPIIGRGALVSTNKRVLLVDHKPLFVKCNEIPYRVVNAISYSRAGLASTIVLNTRLGNVSIRTFNRTCASNFVSAIENEILSE